jgi:hypothetical protein
MTKNPILDELHAAREKLLTDAGGDLDQLVAGIREREARSGHKVVSVPVGGSQINRVKAAIADRPPHTT